MPIPFTCPHCGLQTQVADQFAGQSGPCSRCGQMVTIPSAGGAPASPYGAYPGTPYQNANYPTSFPQNSYPTGPRPSSGGGVSIGLILGIVAGVLLLVVGGLAALLIPAVSAARQAARRTQSMNNLKQMGLAMHNYHDVYNSFPFAGAEEPQYGLGLSWRVRILPFVEYGHIYDQVDFNQPWNAGANQAWNSQMPPVYQSPSVPQSNSNTVYLALTDPEKAPADAGNKWQGTPQRTPIFSHDGRSTRMANIVDGTSNTLLLVEADADQSVPWMQPKDLVFDPNQPKRGLGKTQGKGFNVLMADGSVRFVPNEVDDEVMRNMTYRNDGNVLMLP